MFSTALKYRLEKELGLIVTHCSSMAAVRAIFQSDAAEFALAVLDLNLPDAPNCEALDYVISKGIAPLVFTGSFSDATRDQILAKNVLDYVVKDNPAAIQQLVLAVDRILTSGKTQVLVVDSDPESLQRQVSLIAKQRFQIIAVESGAAALDALDAHGGIDMVVCDLALADMDGFALLDEIRQRHGDDAVRVVGLSTSEDRMVAARFLRAGGDEYIQKPFLVEEFNSRIFHVAAIQKRVQSLHRIAARDYLTDIYNRRYFFEAGPRLVDQAVRRGDPMSIAILDIDQFQRLNDTYGHDAGDFVLTELGAQVKASGLRERDLAGRYGGEEFIVVLTNSDQEQAREVAERIRKKIENHLYNYSGEIIPVTVSMGVSAIKKEHHDATDLYKDTDKALYESKRTGKNKVTLA